MKKVICFLLCLISLDGLHAQAKKDSGGVKTHIPVPVPAAVPADPIYYLLLPESNWDKIIRIMRQSRVAGNEIDDAVNYILQNKVELKPPPAPVPKPDTLVKK